MDTTPAVAVFHVAGEFYAVADLCTHATASMSEGYIEDDGTVECPVHTARFCLRTGRPLCLPATEALQTFAVEVVGDDIYVEVPEKEMA